MEKNNLIIGIDRDEEGGDQTAVSLKVGGDIHVINDPHAAALVNHIEALEYEGLTLKSALQGFIATCLTCQTKNEAEWMEYFCQRINEMADLLGDKDRAVLNARGNITVQAFWGAR